MLIARYDANVNQCDTLDPTDTGTFPALDNDDFNPAVWQFSGQGLTEFAISDKDADRLRILHGTDATAEATDPLAPAEVRYIDLTGNPLSIDDVSFKHIPANIAVILSADSPVNGFQDTEMTVTEGAASYVAVAFPSLELGGADPNVLAPGFTVGGRDANATFDGTDQPFQSLTHRQLIDFGAEGAVDAAVRTAQINSVSDNRIFYLPLQANKDNDNRSEWDFNITINAAIGNAVAGYELTNDEVDITVLDADAPALSVCDRSEDVEAAILALAEAETGALYGGHEKCDDLTLRDLGAIPGLAVLDSDGDNEPIADLIAGDFEGLANAATLSITGAGALPSGIFAGVGSDLGDTGEAAHVQISFAKNVSADDDVAEVGNFKPSTIPQHIFADQEKKQVIILADDLNDEDEGVTSGLDATSYSVEEGSFFFVMTKATETYYVLNGSVIIEGTDASTVSTPTIADTARGTADSPKVARYAISPADDDDGDDESIWLFLFSVADPTSAGAHLADLAAVSVIDDD